MLLRGRRAETGEAVLAGAPTLPASLGEGLRRCLPRLFAPLEGESGADARCRSRRATGVAGPCTGELGGELGESDESETLPAAMCATCRPCSLERPFRSLAMPCWPTARSLCGVVRRRAPAVPALTGAGCGTAGCWRRRRRSRAMARCPAARSFCGVFSTELLARAGGAGSNRPRLRLLSSERAGNSALRFAVVAALPSPTVRLLHCGQT